MVGSRTIPKNVKPGKDFRIAAISIDKRVISTRFRITRKVPLVVILLPLVAGAGAAVAILAGGSDDPPTTPDNGNGDQKISDPKRPSDN